MTNTTKVIIAFSAAALVGCGVIGYGLYRRTAGADLRGAKRKRVRVVATMSLQEFAWEPVARQGKLLAEARDAAADIKSGGASEDAEAIKALRRWEVGCVDLQAQIARITAALAALAKSMELVFPQDPDEQLAPEVVTRLTAAVGKARDADRWATTVEVGRERDRVDITAVVAADLHKLALRANEIEAELARRDSAYAAFVEKAKRADKHGQTNRAAHLREQIDKKWRRCAQADPAKKRTIEKWFAQLADLDGRSKRQGVAEKDLRGIIQQVAKAGTRGTLNKVRPRFEAVVRTADQYDALKPMVEEARRTMAVAEERTAPKRKPTSQEVRKDRKWRLTVEIGKKILVLSKIKGTNPKEKYQILKEWQGVHVLVAQLAKTDNIYAEALAKLLNLHMSKLHMKPASTAQTNFLMPEWRTLKNYTRTHLEKPMEALVRIRGLVLSGAPVRVTGPPGKTVQNPHDLRNREDVLKQLDKWNNLLRSQIDKVRVIAKKNER